MKEELKPTIPAFSELKEEVLNNVKEENTVITKTLIEEIYKRGVQDGYIYSETNS